MKNLIAALFSLMLVQSASAALLTTEGTGPTVEKVNLPATATVTSEGETIKLSSVGAGLRTKKVVFVNVKVYVGQLFVSDLATFKKTEAEALSSLKDQKAVAIQLHFVRDVDAEKVQKSFHEALEANKVSTSDASVKEALDAVAKGGEAKEGKALTILGTKMKDGSEAISYETTSGQVTTIKGSAGFIEKMFAIWLGKPSDDGVTQLKKALLK
jgi:hypothetical protein